MNRWPPATRARAGLSQQELAAIVRRAAELDAAQPDIGPDLDVEDAQAILREAGVTPAAASQALEEWKRGEIAPVPPPPLPDSGGRLSPVVSVERAVLVGPVAVQAALDSELRRQWFERGRQYGAAGAEWVPRTGLLADLRRRFDVRGSLLLDDVSRVRLDVLPGNPGTSRIRLSADLGTLRSRLLGGMVVAPVAAGAAATLIGIPVESLELIVGGLPIGLAVAGGGYLGASRTLDKQKARVDEALHILVDRLRA